MDPQSVPVLVIPTAVGSIVVPSTTVCEVIPRLELKPVPGSRHWVLGFGIWRNTPVSVISFERLAGVSMPDSATPDPAIHRLVVMYPLPGRRIHEYFAFTASGDPRGSSIDADGTSESVSLPPEMPQRFVAGAVKIMGKPAAIPDFEALKVAFYG